MSLIFPPVKLIWVWSSAEIIGSSIFVTTNVFKVVKKFCKVFGHLLHMAVLDFNHWFDNIFKNAFGVYHKCDNFTSFNVVSCLGNCEIYSRALMFNGAVEGLFLIEAHTLKGYHINYLMRDHLILNKTMSRP